MERIEMKKHRVIVAEKTKQRQYISDSDAEMDIRAVEAVRAAVSKAEICKKPIAKYDAATKKAYIEYPDGRREYAKWETNVACFCRTEWFWQEYDYAIF